MQNINDGVAAPNGMSRDAVHCCVQQLLVHSHLRNWRDNSGKNARSLWPVFSLGGCLIAAYCYGEMLGHMTTLWETVEVLGCASTGTSTNKHKITRR